MTFSQSPLFREPGPEGDKQYEAKVSRFYQGILKALQHDGFEPTPTEAVFLRQTIRECFDENDRIEIHSRQTNKQSMDALFTYPEIIARFFWNYFGVPYFEYLKLFNSSTNPQIRTELFKYIQEKLRTDRELL